MQPPYAGGVNTAKYVLGALALALVAAGLVIGLMPVSTAGYDCGTPLGALGSAHHEWEAHDAVERSIGGNSADKEARCENRVSGPRGVTLALFAAAGVLVVSRVMLERTRQQEPSAN